MTTTRLSDRAPDAPDDANDWRYQLRHALTTADELARALELTPDELEGARAAERAGFPIAITPYYLGLIDRADPACPIRRQVVPRIEESQTVPGDLRDPLGEEAHEVAPELVQRYPDRALLLVTDRCAVYCRFCTRSRMVGSGGGPRSDERLQAAFSYLEQHPEVRDVIVSGGDPLAMATPRLLRIIERLRRIPSIDTIRLATRVPVVLPQRITDELTEALRPHHPLWVMTHFNHPKELTETSRAACRRLADAGFPVMNQTVLLRGVNDDADTLAELSEALFRCGVLPYYLHLLDRVAGAAHFEVGEHEAAALMSALRARLPGYLVPRLVREIPGELSKTLVA